MFETTSKYLTGSAPCDMTPYAVVVVVVVVVVECREGESYQIGEQRS